MGKKNLDVSKMRGLIAQIWRRRPDLKHPLVVAGLIGVAGMLAIPFTSRYAEAQRTITLRIETREELVQYTATVQNAFRMLDQAIHQAYRQRLNSKGILELEAKTQEATNRILAAQYILDAHIAFRFRNPEVQEKYKLHADSVNEALSKLVDQKLPLPERERALQQYWNTNMNLINEIVEAMAEDVSPPAKRIYRYVIFGHMFSK